MKFPARHFLSVWSAVALGLALVVCAGLAAQIYDPVQWRLEFGQDRIPPGSTATARLIATVEDGWHIYSTTTQEGIPLAIGMEPSDALAGWRAYQPTPEVVFDPNFQAEVEWYTHSAEFWVEFDLADGPAGPTEIQALVRYGACDDRQCLPPKRKSAAAIVVLDPAATPMAAALPAGYGPVQVNEVGRPRQSRSPGPATEVAAVAAFEAESQGLLGFAMLAFGFGLVAILTPCVFPMIPIYMGSFIGSEHRPWGSIVRQASTFCLGVILLFTAIGAGLSAALGPFGLSQVGSNPWANLLIAVVLFGFALSMLGAFEITMPSSWTTGASQRSAGAGLLPTLMLSLVFTLASFACTGPFVGSLLAGSIASGGGPYLILGMALFATGLSAPFFALGLFPALVGRLPRSGAWLSVTKRTAGLVIVAVGLKYLANVDQVLGWTLLPRERFLALWVVLFAAGGLYLWGVVRFGDDGPAQGIGLSRFAVGAVFLAFAVSLFPGMSGASLGELEAHVPETRSGIASDAGGLAWIKDDFDGAFALASGSGRRLLVSFTGYACSNCKWMKANMFTRAEIAGALEDTVLVELYTDGFDEASERHQELQVDRFRSSSIPFYAIIRPDGSIAATFSGQTRDVSEFKAFVETAG